MVSGEKRNSEEERMVEKVTTVLLDIEGTTTSISFVKVKSIFSRRACRNETSGYDYGFILRSRSFKKAENTII